MPGRHFGYVALTGTPGTGKSTVARALAGRIPSVEVGELALRWRCGRRSGRAVVIDLPKLKQKLRRAPKPQVRTLLVGHLAHLLPVRDVILLRCQPAVLLKRLTRARRGNRRDRLANATAEAIDLILLEARHARRRVHEIDTTRLRPREVAERVARAVRSGGASRPGTVDWLADPSVTRALFPSLAYPSSWSSRATGAGRRRTSRASRARSSRPPRTA